MEKSVKIINRRKSWMMQVSGRRKEWELTLIEQQKENQSKAEKFNQCEKEIEILKTAKANVR